MGFVGLGVPEEIIRATEIFPFRVSGDNEAIPKINEPF